MKIILWNKQWRAVCVASELCYLAYFYESGYNVSADILFLCKNGSSVWFLNLCVTLKKSPQQNNKRFKNSRYLRDLFQANGYH